jgi:hypothetical protein
MSKFHGRRLGRRALVVLLPFALLTSGCTATGMGWIPSQLSPGDKATFGFTFDDTTSTFSGSYHDPQGMTVAGVVDVAFKGTGKLNPCSADPRCQRTAPPSKGGCLTGEPTYQSQNPKVPGSGTLLLIVCDGDSNGDVTLEGGDSILVQVDTGPYMGYTNQCDPLVVPEPPAEPCGVHGNITVKS